MSAVMAAMRWPGRQLPPSTYEGDGPVRRIRRIDLTPLKRRLGRHWPKYENSVFRIALRIARRHAAEDDIVLRHGLALRLDTASADLQADERVSRISRDIWVAFVGPGRDASAEPGTQAGREPPQDGGAPDGGPVGGGLTPRRPQNSRGFDRAVAQAASARDPHGNGGTGWLDTQFEVQFRPRWSPALSKIFLFEALPVRHVEGGALAGPRAINPDWNDSTRIAVSRRIVGDTLAELEALKQRGEVAFVVIPIEYAMLESDEARSWLVGALAASRGWGAQQIALEIASLPSRAADPRVTRWIEELAPNVKVVAARLPIEIDDFSAIKAYGIRQVATSLPGGDPDEAASVRRLRRFYGQLSAQGLRGSITDLTSRSLVLAAATDGYDFIQGPGIGRLGETGLHPPETFAFIDLFAAELADDSPKPAG